MVNKGWIPTDKRVQKISFEQWMFYYLILKRQQAMEYNKQRQLFELNAVIINPTTFQEYYKRAYGKKDDEERPMEVDFDEFGLNRIFKDKDSNMTMSETEVMNLINELPFNKQEG